MSDAIDRLHPTERPSDRPAGFQRWRHLLFLHWEVPLTTLRPLLPDPLTIDTFEGKAYVGVVPFTMRDVAPRWAPSIPGISHFHELNVRTYVHRDGRDPGVWFFSLDAASTVAVVAARSGWHLPYHRARMRLEVDDSPGALIRYTSTRLWPGPRPAALEVDYRVGAPRGPAIPGTLEHFLAERYILYTVRAGALLTGQVHHRPYPLFDAEIVRLSESMAMVNGLSHEDVDPHALYSPGVDVDVYALRAIGHV